MELDLHSHMCVYAVLLNRFSPELGVFSVVAQFESRRGNKDIFVVVVFFNPSKDI
jgi:hypothetical protein